MTDESQPPPEFDPTAGQPAESAPSFEAPAPQWPAEGYPPPPAYPAPPAQPSAETYPAAYPPPAQPMPAAPGVQPGQTSSNAIVAIILAVVSWAICPIIPAIVALVFASNAAKEIAASGGRVQGQGLVTAARVVSWVNIGLWAAIIIVGGFFLVLAVVAGGLDDVNGY